MNTICQNAKVSIAYTLKDTNGRVIEEIPDSHPVVYLQGVSDYLPTNLQQELSGLRPGDSKAVTLTAEQGYGAYQEKLLLEVSKQELEDIGQLWVGMEIELVRDNPLMMEHWQAPNDPFDIIGHDDDDPGIYVVREIRDETVVLDGNHPLAGVDLTFHVKIIDVEIATVQEIEQGYPNPPDDNDSDDTDWEQSGDFNEGRGWR